MTLAKAQIGDVVTRNRRFTESFVEGEEHTVQRVSGCGHYIWVGGHRHKVPVKYFNLIRRSSDNPSTPKPFDKGDWVEYSPTSARRLVDAVKYYNNRWTVRFADNLAQGFVWASEYTVCKPKVPAAPELTDFSEGSFTAAPPSANGEDCGLVAKTEPVETTEAYTARTGYHKFKVGDAVKQVNGHHEFIVHDISSCGYKFSAKDWTILYGWMRMKDFELTSNELVNRDIVAGLILQGINVQYRNLGKWFDVSPNTLTVSMIGRLDFRVKPLTMDYYGNEIPATVDVMKTKVKTVWGISLNNNKIYPCALGTARVNKSKGHGLYWETEQQAQQVLDILMKPFNGATK